jgi:hypothetical protein
LLERDVVRLQRQQVLADGHILGEGAAVDPLLGDDRLAEYRAARTKPCHALADRLDDPRHVRTGDRVLGFGEPSSHQAEDIGSPTHDVPHIRMDRSRSYAHEDFVIADHRLVDFSELQIIGRSVPLLDDRLHRFIKSLRMPSTSSKRSWLHAQATVTGELGNEAV